MLTSLGKYIYGPLLHHNTTHFWKFYFVFWFWCFTRWRFMWLSPYFAQLHQQYSVECAVLILCTGYATLNRSTKKIHTNTCIPTQTYATYQKMPLLFKTTKYRDSRNNTFSVKDRGEHKSKRELEQQTCVDIILNAASTDNA